MPSDAYSLLEALVQRLGRMPSMEEMLSFAGHAPAGMPVDPPSPVPASLRSDEHGDGPLTDAAQEQDLLRANPELLRLRERLWHDLLFGPMTDGSAQNPSQSLFGGMREQSPSRVRLLPFGGFGSLSPGGPAGM